MSQGLDTRGDSNDFLNRLATDLAANSQSQFFAGDTPNNANSNALTTFINYERTDVNNAHVSDELEEWVRSYYSSYEENSREQLEQVA